MFFESIDLRLRRKRRHDDNDAEKTQKQCENAAKRSENGVKIARTRSENGMFLDGRIASDCFEFFGSAWNLIL